VNFVQNPVSDFRGEYDKVKIMMQDGQLKMTDDVQRLFTKASYMHFVFR